jgi:Sec-independent protein translocase protein TatA
MNIFGVGGPELMVILIIMLVFAGPKRMIHWSYILGQYLAKFRVMWSQTVDLVQKEFDEAGVDIKLPKEPPTRKNINKTISNALQPMTKPLQESLDEVKKDVESVKAVSDEFKETATETPTSKPDAESVEAVSDEFKETETETPEPVSDTSSSLGTWSSSTDK